MGSGNNNNNSNNNNNGATPDEIANAIFSFAESAIKLKDAGILSDETIKLANEVAQVALKKLEDTINNADWSSNNNNSNNNSNNNNSNNSQSTQPIPAPDPAQVLQLIQSAPAPTQMSNQTQPMMAQPYVSEKLGG